MIPIVRFYVLYLLAAQVGFSMLMVFARQAHLSTWDMALYGVFLYAVPVTLIPLLRRLPTRRSFAFTLVCLAAGVACMSQLHRGAVWYWIMAPTVGATMVTFWIVYMVRHVTAGPARANAYNSSMIVFLMFGTACVSPVVAGQLAQRFGAQGVILTALSLMAVAATQIRSIKPRVVHLRLRTALPAAPRYAVVLLLLQGMYEALQFLYLPMATTQFLSEPRQFGAFFSAVAFVGSATNLLVSRWSDRVGNRSRMIYLGCTLMAAGALGLATARGVVQWSIAAPMLQTGFTVTLPYFMAVILDAIHDADDALVVREWASNVGRLVSVFVVLGILRTTGNLQHAYFYALAPLIAYPALLFTVQRLGLLTQSVHGEITAATTADVQAEGTTAL